jgi:hypothetical protein
MTRLQIRSSKFELGPHLSRFSKGGFHFPNPVILSVVTASRMRSSHEVEGPRARCSVTDLARHSQGALE